MNTNIEIERKFLPSSTFDLTEIIASATEIYKIKQGYLNSAPERTVRVRTKNQKAFLTIKGIGNNNGTTRFEWEKEINFDEALQLLNLAEEGVIEKTRYEVKIGLHIFEIDIFENKNEGLQIIEIEMTNENESFEKPHWLGVEVTNDKRFFNSYLSNNPYVNWK